MNTKTLLATITTTFALVCTGALASGNHAGGHDSETSALGQPGKAAKVKQTIEISLSDTMRFNPDTLTVKQGDTVRFVVKNDGKLKHELVLGTAKQLKEHAEMMRKFPEMEHADANQATVEPGKTGELIWQFTRKGTFDFACLQAGHFEAGMRGKVVVK
ncbi:cupredoxin domain-containing protein [Andreprevotia chitinilytica]|uniref:cupredoxin domain-containing protein n=1 Tax=Andreprevotia chitinilytica TaxID=396808 RepID=UPI00068B901F|nr:cupredoxin family protein [Andreprevotia chitinilytica]